MAAINAKCANRKSKSGRRRFTQKSAGEAEQLANSHRNSHWVHHGVYLGGPDRAAEPHKPVHEEKSI